MATLPASSPPTVLSALARGFRFSWPVLLIIILVNTGIAAVYWIEDPRPFWHPLLTVQCYGLAIAYCVNTAQPWDSPRPLLKLMVAVAIGCVIGAVLTILFKGYTAAYVIDKRNTFALNLVTGFFNGVFVSLFFLLKIRETRAAAALHKAEAERLLLSKHATESELKLMQAQIEPHFLFNTLASVQYLTETDPPQASRLLGHLLAYLRAALPQMRSGSTTLGQEIELAEAYLNILRMRMGSRLDFSIDVPDALKTHPFPPVLLISIVENAVTHGLEPLAAGGHVAIGARQEGDRVLVTVEDTGIGLSGSTRPGRGVGLINVRERLSALFGARGRFALEEAQPRGARATIEVPAEPASRGARRAPPHDSMTTALIAEDEPMMRAQLKGRLAQAWPELEIVGEAGNGEEALALAEEKRPDIAFLDIRMPVLSGLDVARELAGRCHVVFVTAYDDYAIAAFDEGAVDYVLKPPMPERIAKVVARLKARVAQAPLDLTALLAKIAAQEPASGPLKWIRASLGASMKMIAVDEVIYFRAEDKYTKVVTADGEALIRKPIKDLFEELDPEAFWQIHRSAIVNLRAIARVDRDWRGEPVIVLKGRDETLAVSRTFAHRFKAM